MNTSRKKIYFASDAHLGARFHKDPLAVEKKLVRWLDSIKDEAMAIYFLGDMFDYWYEYKYVVPKGFTRFLGKLAELSDSGIEIHIFIGNHDIWMFDYLPNEIGAVIHRDVLTTDLLGKRFFLGHGDEVDYRSKAFRFIRALFRNTGCPGRCRHSRRRAQPRRLCPHHDGWQSGIPLCSGCSAQMSARCAGRNRKNTG